MSRTIPVKTDFRTSEYVEREIATPTFVHELKPARQVKAAPGKP
jgi:hypothetical protein